MILDEFRECLGTALNNTFLVGDACRFVGDIRAAREVAVDIIIKALINFPEPEQEKLYEEISIAIANREPFQPILEEIDTHFPLGAATIKAAVKAYICKSSEQGNVLARDFSSRKSPFAFPSENPALVMMEWLMAALTFEERQVLLLLRFPDASPTSVAEALCIEETTVRTHARKATKKLTKRKEETTWGPPNEVDNEFIGDVPDWNEFQRIYERDWRPSVTNLAYYLLGDTTGADRIADSVMTRSKPYVEEQESFDIHRAWEGNTSGWIGFKRLTFKATQKFLILFNEKNKTHARAKPDDVWARRLQERLTAIETQVFLLSTLFYKSDDDGISKIAQLTDLCAETVKANIQRAVRKMLDRDWREIE